ncbi:hypothetical protein JMJ77_0008938, partial [Colletotrichum scovillei]
VRCKKRLRGKSETWKTQSLILSHEVAQGEAKPKTTHTHTHKITLEAWSTDTRLELGFGSPAY